MAYIDFAGTVEETRSFMKYFNDLPENLLVLIGFSMSKGYTLYGMRSGAIICVAKLKKLQKNSRLYVASPTVQLGQMVPGRL